MFCLRIVKIFTFFAPLPMNCSSDLPKLKSHKEIVSNTFTSIVVLHRVPRLYTKHRQLSLYGDDHQYGSEEA